MASVTFGTGIGGDGLVVTDDNDPSTGLGNGGHRARFVPALVNTVNITNYAAGRATASQNSANAALNSANEALSSSAVSTINKDLTNSYSQTAFTSQIEAGNSASGANSSATAANLSLLALSDVLSNGIGAFSVDNNGDLSVSYNTPTVSSLTINSSGELLVTY